MDKFSNHYKRYGYNLNMRGKLSSVERRIVRILQRDGRASYSEMGKSLGMTHVAVRKHVMRLIEEGVMKVSACLSPRALDLRHAVVLIEASDDKSISKIIEKFRDCPRLIFLSRLIGGNNIIAIMVAEDINVLESITSVCALRTAEGVRRSEVMVGSSIVYPEYLPIRIVERSEVPCGADCGSCGRFKEGLCPGCPAFPHYKGSL
ncbi:transcriptional regulator, AsnC family [Candidatus Korarchaeum cryptofilum OPF8]|uniref:Transcriptional regulator, AsnC family n=2 Tax=Candidatus Korarchaeum cryptofilum TaxID=498846 RepID=B1L4L0_KORCO|nr:transcriptional regulator, AsnC family [Candidatus Korarchaeum cryptofilum OPF8]